MNLTNGFGTKNEIRFRIVRTEPADPLADYGPGGAAAERQTVDLSKPVTLSAYGECDEEVRLLRAGERTAEGAGVRRCRVQHAGARGEGARRTCSRGRRSSSSRTCASRVPDFKDAKKISDANPQQSEFLWGKRVLFDYKNKDGVRLQGILAIPDDYKPGEKRPMIVTFYEKNSQNLHRYSRAVVSHRHGRVADRRR